MIILVAHRIFGPLHHQNFDNKIIFFLQLITLLKVQVSPLLIMVTVMFYLNMKFWRREIRPQDNKVFPR